VGRVVVQEVEWSGLVQGSGGENICGLCVCKWAYWMGELCLRSGSLPCALEAGLLRYHTG
jgi:hypothetical protein